MIRASSVLFWFGLIIAASLVLYHTSDRVRGLDHQLRALSASIEAEQKNIHVLKAEWVYLANPARIEATAKRHLALRPTSPQQVISLADLDDMLPTRTQAMASVAVSSTPIASLKTSLTMPAPATAHRVKLAAADGHINDHMKIQRTASAEVADPIRNLIETSGTEP